MFRLGLAIKPVLNRVLWLSRGSRPSKPKLSVEISEFADVIKEYQCNIQLQVDCVNIEIDLLQIQGQGFCGRLLLIFSIKSKYPSSVP